MIPAPAGRPSSSPQRVLSLLPAATEMVAALGAGGRLVGISHACDHPASVLHLPRVTASRIDPALPGAAIDAEVRRLKESGQDVVTVDLDQVRALRPDLILTQDLCEVCAVDGGGVRRLVEALEPAPEILRLAGTTLASVEEDIGRVAAALDLDDEAEELVAGMRYRLRRLAARAPEVRRRVVCVEWLDPLYLAGHWVPELVAAAGGQDVGGVAGDKSRRRGWAEVVAMRPELVLVMLCGFGVARARSEWAAFARANPGMVALLGSTEVRWVDGNAFTSRPGPRLVDGAEAIHRALQR